MEYYDLTAFHRPLIFIVASNLDCFFNKNLFLRLYVLSVWEIREVLKKSFGCIKSTLAQPPPPPQAPPKCGLCFFSHHCFIILFQFFDIFFSLKVKKNVKSGLGPNPPPPPAIVDLIHPFFFVGETSLSVYFFYYKNTTHAWGRGVSGM